MASKLSKEEKEQDFIDAVQQLLGFELFSWQKERLLEARGQSLAGKKIYICICSPTWNGELRTQHLPRCPKYNSQEGGDI
jgi:hypothetical protein